MFFRPGKKDEVSVKERSLWGDLISLGMVFPIAIVLGYFFGQWIGGKLGYPNPGRLIGLGFGILTGFWELFKVSRRLDKYDKINEISNNAKDDPKGGSDGE